MWECGNVLMCECGNVLMCECGNVGMWECVNALMCECLNKGWHLWLPAFFCPWGNLANQGGAR